MIIKHLRLKNFGQHANLDLEINGPVIGIIGRNGSGKSTIVTALRYAFTGDLEDNTTTYIKNGEDCAEVECVFEKNGKEGTIIRTINKKTTTRSIIYGPEMVKPITKAKEFDALIDQILGVDKQSLLSAIFIAQGEIANILSPRISERLSLFTKLLNLNYLNKRASFLDTNLTKLKSSVVDVGVLKDSLKVRESELEKREEKLVKDIENANGKYLNKEFVDKVLELTTDYIYKSDEFTRRKAELGDFISRINQEKQILETLCEGKDFNELIDSYKSEIAECESKSEKLRDSINNDQVILGAVKSIAKLKKDKEELENLKQTVFGGLEPSKVKQILDNRRFYNNNSKLLTETKNRIEAVTKSIDINKEELNKCETELKNLPDINILKEDLQKNRSIVFQLQTLRDTKLKLKDRVNKDTAVCPICGLKLLLGQEICDGDISEIEKNINDLNSKINNSNQIILTSESRRATLEKEISKQNTIKSYTEQELKNLIQSKENLVKVVAEYEVFLSEEKLIPDWMMAEAKLSYYESCCNQEAINPMQNVIEQCLQLLNSKGINPDSVNADDLSALLNKTRGDLLQLQGRKSHLNNKMTALINEKNKVEADERALQATQDSIEKINDELKNHQLSQLGLSIAGEHPEVYKKFNQFVIISDTKLAAEQGKAVYDQIEVDKRVIENYKIQNTKDRQLIASLERDNAKTYQMINELSKIKSLLQPSEGITKDYINYLFKSISGYISEYLSYMDANFIIAIEDRALEEDLSFKFQRIDREDKNWYAMSKLSGGQKIKLSIAFQLAIQKIICPDLGFLVLDEPSTHLDAESIEALSTLLENIGTMLSGQNGQVWIIDHNSIVDRAFTTTVRL